MFSLLAAETPFSYTSAFGSGGETDVKGNKHNSQGLAVDGKSGHNRTAFRSIPGFSSCPGLKVLRLETLANQKLFSEV